MLYAWIYCGPFISLIISYPIILCLISDHFNIYILEGSKSIICCSCWFSAILNCLPIGFIIFGSSLFQFHHQEFGGQNLAKLFSRECLLLLLPEAKSLLQPEGLGSVQEFLDHLPYLLIVPSSISQQQCLYYHISSGKICLSPQLTSLVPVPCHSSSSLWYIGSAP